MAGVTTETLQISVVYKDVHWPRWNLLTSFGKDCPQIKDENKKYEVFSFPDSWIILH